MPSSDPASTPKTRRTPVWSLLLIALLLGIAFFGEKGILRTMKLSQEKAALQSRIAELEATQEELRQQIESLRSDRRYIESVARRELGMVKEDEVVYQFSNADKGSQSGLDDPAKP